MDRDLERAKEELELASDRATGSVATQLESLAEGISEEEGTGGRTQSDPGPKVDRVAEVEEKLAALADEAEDAEVRERVATAREALRTYLKTHPDGG